MSKTLINNEKHEYIQKRYAISICIEVAIDIRLIENKT